MRFDTDIYFVTETEGAYDASTGDYADADPQGIHKLANVTDASTETMQLVYGKIKQGALVVRIQGEAPSAFDYIRIGDKRYCVGYFRQLRRVATFTVSEVQ